MNQDNGDAGALMRVARPAKKEPLGARLAKIDPADLEGAYLQAIEAFRDHVQSGAMPDAHRQCLVALVQQISSSKPGMEEVTTKWKIPRMQIVQATTTSASRPDSARIGDLYSSSGKLIVRPHKFVPIHFSYENVMFPPGAKVPACHAPDAALGSPYGECQKCPNLPFGMQNGGRGEQKKTDCQNQIVTIVMSVDDPSQIHLVQFSKTSRRAGSALMSLAGQQRAPWAQSYLLSTEKGQGDMGNYFVFKVEPTGITTPDYFFESSQMLCNIYTAGRHMVLGDHWRAVQAAPEVAAAVEAEFSSQQVAVASEDAEDFELGDGAKPSSSVRTSAKPM